MKKIEQSIATLTFILKQRREKVEAMESRLTLNENQKIFIGQEYDLFRNVEFLVNEYKKEVKGALGMWQELPKELALERTVLGALILEGPALQLVRGYLKPEHFYHTAHQEIYRAVLDLKKVDMRTVVEQLRKNGKIEEVGGALYIAELTSVVSLAANLDFHARILMEYALKRELILLNGTIRNLFDSETDVFEVMDMIEGRIKQLKGWLI